MVHTIWCILADFHPKTNQDIKKIRSLSLTLFDMGGGGGLESTSCIEFETPCQIGLSQILKLDKQKWS